MIVCDHVHKDTKQSDSKPAAKEYCSRLNWIFIILACVLVFIASVFVIVYFGLKIYCRKPVYKVVVHTNKNNS